MKEPFPSRSGVLVPAVAVEGGVLLLWLFLGQVLGRPPSSQGTITLEAFGQGVAATIPLIPFMVWLSRSRIPALRDLVRKIDEVLVPLLSRLTTADFLLLSLLAGFGEEGLFRGIIQAGLSEALSPVPALMIASLLFGLLHLVTPAYGLIAGILGLYLGGLFLLTGNLLVPIIVHALYDFIALVYLVRIRRGDRAASR